MPEWPSDVSAELRQHLDDQYRELRAAGASHDEAMRLMADDVKAVRSSRASLRPELIAADVRSRWRSGLAPTRRSSRSSMACCCVRCRIATRTD
jgi:hypothetical protein